MSGFLGLPVQGIGLGQAGVGVLFLLVVEIKPEDSPLTCVKFIEAAVRAKSIATSRLGRQKH